MTQDPLPRLALSVLAACYFAMAIASLSVIGLLIPLREGLAISASEVAFLVSIFSVTYAVSSPLAQVAIGDWDRRRLLVLGLSGIALGTAMTAVAQGYALAVAGRAVMALGAGITGPMASAAGAALVREARRGAALGHVFAGMTFATVLGVPVTTWLGDAIGWRAALWAVTAFALATAVAVRMVVPDAGRGARASLRGIGAVLTDRVLAPAISVTGWQMAAQFVTYAVIAVYLIERFSLPRAWIPFALATFGVGGIFGNIVATRLIDRLGPDRLILVSLTGTAAVFLLLQVSGALPWLGLFLMFVWPVTALALFAPQQARLIALRPEAANLLLALNGAAIYAGMGLGSAIGGVLIAQTGTDWLALASALLALVAIGAYQLSRR